MSRPASAACVRCHTRIFCSVGNAENPSAYSCTTAASSICSSRYCRFSQFIFFAMGRSLDVPIEFGLYPRFQGIHRSGLAVNQTEGGGRLLEALQPAHHFVAVGM